MGYTFFAMLDALMPEIAAAALIPPIGIVAVAYLLKWNGRRRAHRWASTDLALDHRLDTLWVVALTAFVQKSSFLKSGADIAETVAGLWAKSTLMLQV